MAEPIATYWDVVGAVWDQIDIDDPDVFAKTIAAVPKPAVHLYSAHFANSEICNGGFLQFFMNSTGVLAPEAIQGFHAIGMTELASVVERAAHPLGRPYPRVRHARWHAMLAPAGLTAEIIERTHLPSKVYPAWRSATEGFGWTALESRYYALENSENGGFEAAATAYAKRTQTE